MKIRRRAFLALAGFASILAVTPASHAADTLNIGAYPSNPPFELKSADGTFEGFEIDIATEAARRAGLEPEIADYGFQALFAATTSRRIDVAVSSITITPERLKSQSFTQPYYDSDIGVATKADSTIAGLADLNGKTVGALSGSTGEKWVKDNKDVRASPISRDIIPSRTCSSISVRAVSMRLFPTFPAWSISSSR